MASNVINIKGREITPTTSEQQLTIESSKDTPYDMLVNLIKVINLKDSNTGVTKYFYQFTVAARGLNNPRNTIVKYRELFVAFKEQPGEITNFFTALDTTNVSVLQAIPISTNSTGILYHIFYTYDGTGAGFNLSLLFQSNTILTNTSDPQEFALQDVVGTGNPINGTDTTNVVGDLNRVVTIFTIEQVPVASSSGSTSASTSGTTPAPSDGTAAAPSDATSSGEAATPPT